MTTRSLIIRPDAQRDVREAAHWYEARRPGLGKRFSAQLGRLMNRVADSPLQFPEIDEGVRRALLQRFPYAMYFTVASDAIIVIAILHQHRHPNTWKER